MQLHQMSNGMAIPQPNIQIQTTALVPVPMQIPPGNIVNPQYPSAMMTVDIIPPPPSSAPARRQRLPVRRNMSKLLPYSPVTMPVEAFYLAPEATLFGYLVDVERRVDAIVARNTPYISGMNKENLASAFGADALPMLLSSSAHGIRRAPPTSFPLIIKTTSSVDHSTTVPTWSLSIDVSISEAPARPLGSLVKRVCAILDGELFPSDNFLEWSHAAGTLSPTRDKPLSITQPFPATLLADPECTSFDAHIQVEVNHSPPVYKSSTQLAKMLPPRHFMVLTQPQLLTYLWSYIKGRKLVNTDNIPYVDCSNDPSLFAICGGRARFPLSDLPELATKHLEPLGFVQLRHTIHITPGSVDSNTTDANIYCPPEFKLPCYSDQEKQELSRLDASLQAHTQLIQEHIDRREFLLTIATNPLDAFKSVVKEHEAASRADTSNPDYLRKAGFYMDNQIIPTVHYHWQEKTET